MVSSMDAVREGYPVKHLCFRPAQNGKDLLARGDSPGKVAQEAVRRYYLMIAHASRTLRFSVPEAHLISLALRDYELVDETVDLVWARLQQEIERQNLGELCGVDNVRGLVSRVKAMSVGQVFALLDAIERYWRQADLSAMSNGMYPPPEDGLISVGLAA